MKFYELTQGPIPIMKFTDADEYYLQVVCLDPPLADVRRVGLQSDADEYPMFDEMQWLMINKAITSFLVVGSPPTEEAIEERMEWHTNQCE